ncbi:MAG: hypothetical protein QHH30_01590, partial [candidate division NC10 bacterium]|nr:hypothetical protein [candidate division NC10 bacterium]
MDRNGAWPTGKEGEPIEILLERLPREEILALAQNEKLDPNILDTITRKHLNDEEVCRAVLRHPGVSVATLCYVARHASPSFAETLAHDQSLLGKFPEIRHALLDNPSLGLEVKEEIQKEAEKTGLGPPKEKEQRKKDLSRMIRELSAGQRLALAKKGNKEVRMILIRDPNEMVALEVISSPRITDSEVIYISQMRDVSEKVLRAIASNRRYRSHKEIILNLLHNPKTPVSVSLGLGIPR